MTGRLTLVACVAIAAFLVSPSAHAVVWHVNAAGTGDAPTIQAAFDAAAPGDAIELAPGTYTDISARPTPYGLAIAVAHMSEGVDIYGASGAGATFIDGQGVRRGLFGYQVADAEISGITFLDCYTSGAGGGVEKWGGGVLLFNSSATVRECVFADCVALPESQLGGGGGGGGLMLFNGPSAAVYDNLFVRCVATDIGGGMELYGIGSAQVVRNTFVGNGAERGGGALLLNQSAVSVDNNVFASNYAGQNGGGVWCLNDSVVSSSCNLFWENVAPVGDHADACGEFVGVNENLVADPLFCDPVTDDYAIRTSSPAAPGHPSGCGLRGAFPVACGPVSIEELSWGRLKSGFRQ